MTRGAPHDFYRVTSWQASTNERGQQLRQFFPRFFGDLAPLARQLRFVHLALRTRGQVRPYGHRERARDRGNGSSHEHDGTLRGGGRYTGHEGGGREQTVLATEDHLADACQSRDALALAFDLLEPTFDCGSIHRGSSADSVT